MIKAVFYGIDNLEELKKLKVKKRRAENVYFMGFIKTLVDLKVIPDLN